MNSSDTNIWRPDPINPQNSLKLRNHKLAQGITFNKILFGLLLLVCVLLIVGWCLYSSQNQQNQSILSVPENTIFVRHGEDFQSALDRAKPGDTILLEAGATFRGSFNLPLKTGNEFITIQSSAAKTALPPVNARLEPIKYAGVLPKLESDVKGQPVILAINGAHHFRFVGIEFGPTIEGLGNIIQIGTGEEKSVAELPHDLEFDRVWIRGSKTEGQRRGIAANGKNIKIQNSYFSDIKRRGEESQAIAIWATDGPIEITNNYLEGAAENILFGGAGSHLKLVPTDCLVSNNHLNKPIEWRAENWAVKNLFEIKNGKRIRVENNLMTNNWGMAQDGTAILFTTRADNGAATVIEDIEFTDNIVRGAGNAINIYGAEGGGGRRLRISNNLFEDINAQKWSAAGYFMKSTAWDDLSIENNTILQTGSITNGYGAPVTKFVFRNNIVFENEYGFKGDDEGSGKATIDRYFPRAEISFNAFIRGNTIHYGEKSLLLDSIKEIGFVDVETGNYVLSSDSLLKTKGLNGKPIGANLNAKTVGKQ